MKTYEKVGFSDKTLRLIADRNDSPSGDGAERDDAEAEEANLMDSIPRQVKQFWMEVPVQYRLVYLLMFLYVH